MWIMTPNSYVSIVAHRTMPDAVMVRARLRGDIQRLFGKVHVVETPEGDYRFRTVVSRRVAAGVIGDAVAGNSYPNVKDAIPHRGAVHQLRHSAMVRTWTVWNQAQAANLKGAARLPPVDPRLEAISPSMADEEPRFGFRDGGGLDEGDALDGFPS